VQTSTPNFDLTRNNWKKWRLTITNTPQAAGFSPVCPSFLFHSAAVSAIARGLGYRTLAPIGLNVFFSPSPDAHGPTYGAALPLAHHRAHPRTPSTHGTVLPLRRYATLWRHRPGIGALLQRRYERQRHSSSTIPGVGSRAGKWIPTPAGPGLLRGQFLSIRPK